jgi:hypothetical protein
MASCTSPLFFQYKTVRDRISRPCVVGGGIVALWIAPKVPPRHCVELPDRLTNLSEVELEADQVPGMYGQRWGIEDFFEEGQNQYYLNKFPGTSLAVVKRHIILTFLLYTLVKRFGKW